MKVSEIMTSGVTTAKVGEKIERIIELMKANGIGCVPIVAADGKLTGIVTNSDLIPKEHRGPFRSSGWAYLLGLPMLSQDIEQIYQGIRERPVEEVMSTPVICVSEGDEIEAVVKVMMRDQVDHVPVVQDGVPVGMVTRRDLMSVMI